MGEILDSVAECFKVLMLIVILIVVMRLDPRNCPPEKLCPICEDEVNDTPEVLAIVRDSNESPPLETPDGRGSLKGSGSMRETFYWDTDFTYKIVKDPSEVRIGGIYVFKRKNYSVIHRVVGMINHSNEIIYIFKGDNNQYIDQYPVYFDNITERVIRNYP